MGVLQGTAWFIAFLTVWFSFIVYGWQWADGVDSTKAMAFWLLMSIVLGMIGGFITVRITRNNQ